MPGTDSITIFPLGLLAQRRDLAQEVLQAVARFNATIGWHYLLDLVWLLEGTERLPRGSVVLDAGAGNGLLQMLLAARGHKVLSVDFAPRQPPEGFRQAARIRVVETGSFSNEYLTHLSETYQMAESGAARSAADLSPLAVLAGPDTDIVYCRADLSDLSFLPAGAVDAVVSLSALEHNTPQGMAACVRELERVLRPGQAMHVTISGSDRGDWFHEPSKGWCFSEQSLVEHFGLAGAASNYDQAGALLAELRQGQGLKEHLAQAYFASGNNGMPWGRWAPQYFPVGVRKWKA